MKQKKKKAKLSELLNKKRLAARRKLLGTKLRWKQTGELALFASSRVINDLKTRRRLKSILGPKAKQGEEIRRLTDELIYKRAKGKTITKEEAEKALKLRYALNVLEENSSKSITQCHRYLDRFREFEEISKKLGLQVSKKMRKSKSTLLRQLAEEVMTQKLLRENLDKVSGLLAQQN